MWAKISQFHLEDGCPIVSTVSVAVYITLGQWKQIYKALFKNPWREGTLPKEIKLEKGTSAENKNIQRRKWIS